MHDASLEKPTRTDPVRRLAAAVLGSAYTGLHSDQWEERKAEAETFLDDETSSLPLWARDTGSRPRRSPGRAQRASTSDVLLPRLRQEKATPVVSRGLLLHLLFRPQCAASTRPRASTAARGDGRTGVVMTRALSMAASGSNMPGTVPHALQAPAVTRYTGRRSRCL